MMDGVRRLMLQNQREIIVRDLDVQFILDDLYSKNVINQDEKELILSERTRRDQARCLLDILPTNTNSAYDTFVDILHKDYEWLYKSLAIGNGSGGNVAEIEEKSYYDALTLGDLPRLPPHYVPRKVELENLRRILRNLKRGSYVMVHGMPGSGKSCLCTAAINDRDLLNESFNNHVYWINAGEVKNDTDILTHLNRLYKKLLIESNENESRPHSMTYPPYDDIELLKYELKKTFSMSYFHDSLIVLDDVSSEETFNAFDLSCKCLITTREKSVAPNYGENVFYLSLTRGFTQQESLTLFAKCIGTDVVKLPQDAHTIHKLCKGAPILIALIGSMLENCKEDAKTNKDCWKYCIDKLTSKEFRLKNYQKTEQEKLFSAIEMCINNLSNDLKQYYKSLAIFVEDLNIMPNVLQVMWKLKKYPVEEIMTELKNKSLIVANYNKDLKSNVYAIHDLLLTYLKKQINESERIRMHYDLMMNYYEMSGGNFAHLPNDNYIYSYIAYHLTEAQLWSKFATIYYDLDFIAAKIRAVGSMDLLSDYSRYKKFICHQDSFEMVEKFEELKDFVRIHGNNIYKYVYTDIVQYALQQSSSSFLYQQAMEIVQKRPSNLYFNFQHQKENVYYTHTLNLQEEVCSACFTNDTNHILVATNFGQINLWEQKYKRILCTFRGHKSKITYIELSPDASSFLSVSEDGTVKLWSLEEALCMNSKGAVFDENGFTEKAPSPRFKQENWHNFFENNYWVDQSRTFRPQNDNDAIISASFSYDNEFMVTGTRSGIVNVWHIKSQKIVLTIQQNNSAPIKCCIFSLDDTLIIFSVDTKVFLYDTKTGDFLSNFCTDCEPTRLLVVPFADNSLVVIGQTKIAVWSWEREFMEMGFLITDAKFRLLDRTDETQYLCGAVTCDGRFVVAGSTDSTIRMWNIETGHIVKELHNNDERVICLDTFWNEDESAMHILLSGSDDRTVKQWHVKPVELNINRQPMKLLPIFSTYWPPGSSLPYLAVVDNENRLRVMCGHNLISETEFKMAKINAVAFSRCGDRVALGRQNGLVEEFDYQSRRTVPIMNLHGSVNYLEYLEETSVALNGNGDESTTTLLSKRRNGSLKINIIKNQCLVASSIEKGSFMIYRNQKSLLLSNSNTTQIESRHINDNQSQHKNQQQPVIKCFMLKTIMKMLSISKDRSLKVWDLDSGQFTVLEGNLSNLALVQSVSIAADESLIAVSLTNCEFQIFKLLIPSTFQDLSNVRSSYYQGKRLQRSIYSSDFSSDACILALGLDNGHIMLWSVLNNCEITSLTLHRSPVRYLMFSPFNDPLILVSVSEQVAWWSIKDVEALIRCNNRYKRRSIVLSNTKTENNNEIVVKSDSLWKLKVCNPNNGNKKELLSAIKLCGSYASQMSVNCDFNSFFTIDSNGYLYFLNVLK